MLVRVFLGIPLMRRTLPVSISKLKHRLPKFDQSHTSQPKRQQSPRCQEYHGRRFSQHHNEHNVLCRHHKWNCHPSRFHNIQLNVKYYVWLRLLWLNPGLGRQWWHSRRDFLGYWDRYGECLQAYVESGEHRAWWWCTCCHQECCTAIERVAVKIIGTLLRLETFERYYLLGFIWGPARRPFIIYASLTYHEFIMKVNNLALWRSRIVIESLSWETRMLLSFEKSS